MANSQAGDVARTLGIAAMVMIRRDITDRQERALKELKERAEKRKNGK